MGGVGGWRVEHHRGSAAAFHARELPAPPVRSVWVHEVTAPALVLGSAQRDDVVDAGAAARAGVEVVRRRSGGGAVLLVPGEVLWVDVVLPRGDAHWVDDVGRSMGWLGDAWARVLGGGATVHRGPMVHTAWSAQVCFAGLGPGEVVRGGRKLVGISQRRTRDAARFQCALYRRWDPAALAPLLALDEGDRTRLVGEVGGAVDTDDLAVERLLNYFQMI